MDSVPQVRPPAAVCGLSFDDDLGKGGVPDEELADGSDCGPEGYWPPRGSRRSAPPVRCAVGWLGCWYKHGDRNDLATGSCLMMTQRWLAAGILSLGLYAAVAAPPKRIVSIAPSATEILYGVGAFDRVVAVSEFDTYPPAVKLLPRVGGWHTPNLERLAALRPDLIVMTEAQAAFVLDQLRQMGIPRWSRRASRSRMPSTRLQQSAKPPERSAKRHNSPPLPGPR